MQVLLVALAFWLAGAPSQEGPAAAATPPPPPPVHVEPQPGAPLRIVSVKTKWAVPNRSGIELYVTVEHALGRPVDALEERAR